MSILTILLFNISTAAALVAGIHLALVLPLVALVAGSQVALAVGSQVALVADNLAA